MQEAEVELTLFCGFATLGQLSSSPYFGAKINIWAIKKIILGHYWFKLLQEKNSEQNFSPLLFIFKGKTKLNLLAILKKFGKNWQKISKMWIKTTEINLVFTKILTKILKQ